MSSSVREHRTHVGQLELRGTGASAGRKTGPARLVRDARDLRDVQPGDIVVCRSLPPDWPSSLPGDNAVIAESGGALSAAATGLRERGIPAVLAARGAMQSIRHGGTVTVDGSAGAVRIYA